MLITGIPYNSMRGQFISVIQAPKINQTFMKKNFLKRWISSLNSYYLNFYQYRLFVIKKFYRPSIGSGTRWHQQHFLKYDQYHHKISSLHLLGIHHQQVMPVMVEEGIASLYCRDQVELLTRVPTLDGAMILHLLAISNITCLCHLKSIAWAGILLHWLHLLRFHLYYKIWWCSLKFLGNTCLC